LPIQSRSSRIKIESIEPKKKEESEFLAIVKIDESKPNNNKKSQPKNVIPSETSYFTTNSKILQEPELESEPESEPEQLDLQEIPTDANIDDKQEITEISIDNSDIKLKKIDIKNFPSTKKGKKDEPKSKLLQEIEPRPFEGSVIASKGVYGPPKKKASDDLEILEVGPILKEQKPKEEKLPLEKFEVKRKRLEEDMFDVLQILSKKFKTSKSEKNGVKFEAIKENEEVKEVKDEIPPKNMNEILRNLLKLDLHVEATAILRREEILASAISSRISDTLLATIGQNLSMMGIDIIEGLSAGPLKSISLRGENGVLDLAPIDTESASMKDMILILFSHPKVKSGIISFATSIVKKQLKEYLQMEE